MPELPEVEGYRKYIEGTAMETRIRDVEVRDAHVLLNPTEEFRNALKGNHFATTDRVGKFLFLNLHRGGTLLMHFGMTGSPRYYRDQEDEPKFPRVIFHLENDFSLAFNCPRKLGRLKIGPSVATHVEDRKLGPDARTVGFDAFQERLSGRRTSIKNALMSQCIFAGLGNWMVDEILYQAKIHPEDRVNVLDEAALREVHAKMHHVIEVALEHEAHYPDFPAYFMIHSRWTDAGRPEAATLELEKIKVGGRATYFDPLIQVPRSAD